MKLSITPHLLRTALFTAIAFLGVVPLSRGSQEDEPEKPGELIITVVDEDGEPISNAHASLSLTQKEKEAAQGGLLRVQQARTDPDGQAALSIAPGEERELTVTARSLAGERVKRSIAPLEPLEIRPIEIVMRTKDDATYTAVVLDDATGEPLSGVVVDLYETSRGVALSAPAKPLRAPKSPQFITDARGYVTFPAATWRKRTVGLFAEGFAVRFLRIGGDPKAVGLVKADKVRLKREAVLQIRLIDAPQEVSVRAIVYGYRLFSPELSRQESMGMDKFAFEAEPLDDGETYVIYGLPPSIGVQVAVLKGRKTMRLESLVVTPAAGENKRLAMDLATNGVVRGRALDVDGKPVSGKEIWLAESSGWGGTEFHGYDKPLAKKRTAEDGSFEFKGLAPAKYLVAYAGQRRRQLGLETPVAPGHHVEVTAEGGPIDVVIQEVMGLVISGKLLDPDGDPIRGFVMARDRKTRWERQLNVRSDNGAFSLGPFCRGRIC